MNAPKTEKPPTARQSSGIRKADQRQPPIYACLEDFRAYIKSAYGLALLGDLKADGQFHGLGTDQDKHGAKPFRYCVHLDGIPNIYFQDLKRGFEGTWFPEGHAPLYPAEREARRREVEAKRAEREKATADKHASAAKWAQALWRRAAPASPEHSYLVRKGVGVHGLRFLPEWERRAYDDKGYLATIQIPSVLLVPMKDANGELWNVQAIFPEPCPALGRDKDFLPGGRKRGLFHWLGRRTSTVCLAEGYATGASLFEATGYRVLVCFDAGNLPVVAEIVRGALPDARIVVCGDHDEADERGRRAGPEKAEAAARRVGGFVAMPPNEGQDFNDWAQSLKGAGHGG